MQKMLGYMRKAIEDYRMLEPGDRVAVGVSGGKDSVVLLAGLAKLRRILPVQYELAAVSLDPGFEGKWNDYGPIQELCDQWEIPYLIKRTQIGELIFVVRKESNPCSLCARMRRGALHDAALELGCNKIALGHHYDDAIETFMLNLFNEGRIGCFQPVTYLSRKDLTMIRPLIYAPEREIRAAVRRTGLPVVKNPCPVDGATQRQWMKEYLAGLERERHGIKKRLFGAMVRGNVSGWGKPERDSE